MNKHNHNDTSITSFSFSLFRIELNLIWVLSPSTSNEIVPIEWIKKWIRSIDLPGGYLIMVHFFSTTFHTPWKSVNAEATLLLRLTEKNKTVLKIRFQVEKVTKLLVFLLRRTFKNFKMVKFVVFRWVYPVFTWHPRWGFIVNVNTAIDKKWKYV